MNTELQQEMEKRNPSKSKNPAKYFLEWKGGNGHFEYWNGEAIIELEPPFSFLPLDILSTVQGFSDKLNKNIIGTEVRNAGVEPITLRTFYKTEGYKRKQTTLATGLWKKDLKGNYPVSFYQSIYGIGKIENEVELINIKVGKAGLSDLINAKINPKNQFLVTFGKGEFHKKGLAKWYTLAINQNTQVPQEFLEIAANKYRELQKYLDQYLDKTAEEEAQSFQEEIPSGVFTNDEETDIPNIQMPF